MTDQDFAELVDRVGVKTAEYREALKRADAIGKEQSALWQEAWSVAYRRGMSMAPFAQAVEDATRRASK